MFIEDKLFTSRKKPTTRTIDYYFIDDEVLLIEEINLIKARNKLIAHNYTQADILSGSLEENTKIISDDFKKRNNYFSYLYFERSDNWDWINPLGTVSFFLDQESMPGFEQMPKKSINKFYEVLKEDLNKKTDENKYFSNEPKLMELGRFATNPGAGKEVLYNVVGSALQTAAAARYFSFNPKSHFILCTNKKHSLSYEKIFGFKSVPETLSDVYNNKDGVFSYLHLDDIFKGRCGKFVEKSGEYKPDVLEPCPYEIGLNSLYKNGEYSFKTKKT